MAYLRIEVGTAEMEEGLVYVHKLKLDANKVDILDAVETLYGAEEVTSISMSVAEDVEEEEED